MFYGITLNVFLVFRLDKFYRDNAIKIPGYARIHRVWQNKTEYIKGLLFS